MTEQQILARREAKRRYRLAHPDKIKEEKRRYYLRHQERLRAESRDYARAKVEQCTIQKLRWVQANRTKRREISENYRRKNLRKYACKEAVRRAVKAGLVIKATACSLCEGRGALQAHHHKGYDDANRLNVVWLCVPCHRRAHRAII